MKLCSRLFMVFCLSFCEKRQIWVSEPHFGEVRGDAIPWLMACSKANDRLSIRVNRTFFAIYYDSGVMRQNVYSSAVFTGDRPLCTQILCGQCCPPSTILGIKILETLGYPMVKTASLCVLSFWHNIVVWWADGRICRSIYSTCKASFVAHCKNQFLFCFKQSFHENAKR